YGGLPEQCLGSVQVTDVGSALEVTADYSPVAVYSRHLEVLRSNQVVAVVNGNTGLVARVPACPGGCGKLGPSRLIPNGPPILCYWIDWPQPIKIELGEGVGLPGIAAASPQTVLGDELRILAENPPGPLDYLSEFDIHAAGIPAIILYDETVGRLVLHITRSGNQATISWSPNVGTLQS